MEEQGTRTHGTSHLQLAHLPFIAPDPCHLRLSIKRHHYPQPAPYAAAFRAARKPGTPPQTAAAIPSVPAGPGLGGAEEGGPEPQPRSSPQGAPPFPRARYPRPYPPARRGAAARAPGPRGRRGGGPPGVGSWRAARPWRRRTACTSSGLAYAPTRCGWEPRGLRAGRTRSARALGEGGSDPSQPPQQLPGVGAWGGGR